MPDAVGGAHGGAPPPGPAAWRCVLPPASTSQFSTRGSTATAPKCADSLSSTSEAVGMRPASHRVCATGENTSSSPCQSSTGRLITSTGKPQGEVKDSASSIQPVFEPLSASEKLSTSMLRMPKSATTLRSGAGSSEDSHGSTGTG